jgi:hypothetical protein
MIDQAILKLTEEMNSNKNPYIQAVGDKLIQLCDNEYVAEKIMQEGKTIKGAMDDMLKEATKRREGNSAVIDPIEGYNIIMNYFGIKEVALDVKFAQTAGKKKGS